MQTSKVGERETRRFNCSECNRNHRFWSLLRFTFFFHRRLLCAWCVDCVGHTNASCSLFRCCRSHIFFFRFYFSVFIVIFFLLLVLLLFSRHYNPYYIVWVRMRLWNDNHCFRSSSINFKCRCTHHTVNAYHCLWLFRWFRSVALLTYERNMICKSNDMMNVLISIDACFPNKSNLTEPMTKKKNRNEQAK